MMRLSEQDITVLRELGKRYMAYASLPVQEEKRQPWHRTEIAAKEARAAEN